MNWIELCNQLLDIFNRDTITISDNKDYVKIITENYNIYLNEDGDIETKDVRSDFFHNLYFQYNIKIN